MLGVTHGEMNNQIVSGGCLVLTQSVGGALRASQDTIFNIFPPVITTTLVTAFSIASMCMGEHVKDSLHAECAL